MVFASTVTEVSNGCTLYLVTVSTIFAIEVLILIFIVVCAKSLEIAL
jgi:hypothetical protein